MPLAASRTRVTLRKCQSGQRCAGQRASMPTPRAQANTTTWCWRSRWRRGSVVWRRAIPHSACAANVRLKAVSGRSTRAPRLSVRSQGGTGLGLTRRGTESSTKRGPAEPAPSWWNSGMLLALPVRCSCSTLNSRCPSRERFLPYKLSIQIGVPERRGLSATHAAMQADAMLDKGDLDGRAAPAGDRRCSWGPERPAMAA